MASASSRSVAASSSVTPAKASSSASSRKPRLFSAQRSVVPAGRSASATALVLTVMTGSPGTSAATVSREMRMRPRILARPNCGWPSTAGSGISSLRMFQERSSSCRSRPGSTTAPPGRRAMTDNRAAAAGFEPVEPAAITGPAGGCFAKRSASRRISALRWAAGLEKPFSASTAGQASDTIARKSSVTFHQPDRSSPTMPASLSQPVSSLSISSISRARSRASQTASAEDTGTSTSSANFARMWSGKKRFHCCTKGASSRSRSIGGIGGRRSSDSGAVPPNCQSVSPCSNSPKARTVGRIAERPAVRFAKRARSSRAARRVGRKIVALASASGSLSPAEKPGTRRPSISASASAGRKGTPGGTVQTRGSPLTPCATPRAFNALGPLGRSPAPSGPVQPRPPRARSRPACRP